MLATMASPKSSELSDYEVMFKRHVHDNLLLNSDLRLIDEMKKSKLKELKRNRDQFKIRFSRFNKHNSQRSVPDGRYTGNSTPRAITKPSFLVCKTSPCSLKTWSNLTNLTKEKVDVYKTDVLQSEEAVVSFRKNLESNSSTEKYAPGRKVSSALLPERNPRESTLFRSKSTLTKSFDGSDRKTEDETEAEVGNYHLPDFRQRSSTMPSYAYRTRPHFSKKAVGAESVNKLSCKEKECRENNTKDVKANESENLLNKSHPSVIVTDHSPDNIAMSEENELKVVTFDLPENNFAHDNDSKETTFPEFGRKFHRAKSVVIPRHQLSPQMFRRRSYTLDSTHSMKKAGEKLLHKRENVDKFSIAVRRLSLFDKLLSASISSAEDESDTEWSKCYDDLERCRYLRVPGQSIQGSSENLSLENVSFGQSE